MDCFNDIILSLILITFPILIYFIYCCYKNLKGEKNTGLVFGLAMITSLYLSFRFIDIENNNKVLLLCNIPIIISYLKNKSFLGIFLSSLLIIYCCLFLDFNIYFLLIKYILYFITYFIYIRKKNSIDSYIKSIAILQGFFLSFEYFSIGNNNISAIMGIFLVVFIFYLIPFLILYLFSLVDKITSIYLSAKELEREKQIKSSLFKITHEVKNPIAVCKGYLDMIDLDNEQKVKKYIPIIKQEIDRSLNIMNDFMELSKIKINPEIVDINLLLDDVYDGFKLLINSRNIEINYTESSDEVYIMGDYNRLKQVLLNILKNSIEAISDKGEITINNYIKNKEYFIEVSDNGSGMDKETLSKIKDLFFTTKINGTGLGVSLSNEIIKAHHGKIEYKSKVNNGTKVTIKLPIKV